MLKLYATDHMDVRVASSWKPWSSAVAWLIEWTDGRPTPALVGWMELCFNRSVVCCFASPLLLPLSPSPHAVCVYRNEPYAVVVVAAFYIRQ